MSLDRVRLLPFLTRSDERGSLTVVQPPEQIPFAIARVFYLHHLAPGKERGNHAHRRTEQVIVAAHGSCRVELSDGRDSRVFELNDSSTGLYVPCLIRDRLFDSSPNALILVFSSLPYDPNDYIWSREELLELNS